MMTLESINRDIVPVDLERRKQDAMVDQQLRLTHQPAPYNNNRIAAELSRPGIVPYQRQNINRYDTLTAPYSSGISNSPWVSQADMIDIRSNPADRVSDYIYDIEDTQTYDYTDIVDPITGRHVTYTNNNNLPYYDTLGSQNLLYTKPRTLNEIAEGNTQMHNGEGPNNKKVSEYIKNYESFKEDNGKPCPKGKAFCECDLKKVVYEQGPFHGNDILFIRTVKIPPEPIKRPQSYSVQQSQLFDFGFRDYTKSVIYS